MTYDAGATRRPALRSSEVLVSLLRGSWLVLLGLVLGAGIGFLVSELAPPSYQAKTSLLVTPISGTSPGEARLSNYTRAYSGLATAPEVVGEAARESGANPEEIQRSVHVEASSDSPLFQVTASSNDPERAARLANSVGTALASFTEGLSADAGYRAEVVAEAAPPGAPSWPNTPLNAAAGATVGLLVGGMAALAWGGRPRRAERAKKEPDEKSGAAVDPPEREIGVAERDVRAVGDSELPEDSSAVFAPKSPIEAHETAEPVAFERDPESPPAEEAGVGEAVKQEPLSEEPETPPKGAAEEDDAGDGYDPWFWRLRRAGFAAESGAIGPEAERDRGGIPGRRSPGERG